MPKIELVALAATGLLIFGGVFTSAPAFAEDEEFENQIEEHSSETELKHQELEEKYGKEGHLTLPPLLIRPHGFHKPHSGSSEDRPTETLVINPEENVEIDISAVSPVKKTPTDVFLESATTGLFAMGFGAVGLGVVAGTRAIRRR